ncbi:hypothetical protein LWI29_015756 [Acer saccharum]|uniref:RNase H type-1 domain-containing protein n=1 Tax=Acer saccharum TaxID=4024 RepID=A0AA39VIY7_ACESA|nr:hypothetical protein LWI29_015756 [Acer saccharum]
MEATNRGFWKINIDTASYYNERLIGLGMIIHDSVGKVKFAAAQKLVALVSPFMAEALVVRNGIQMDYEADLVPFQIEFDSLQVVDLVRKGIPFAVDVGPVIAKISKALQSLPRCFIDHVPCKGNVAAHSLARKALSLESDYR